MKYLDKFMEADICFLGILGPHLGPMEVPKLGVKSEQQVYIPQPQQI